MGFDLNIHVNLYTCPKTGQAYYLDKNLKTVYSAPTLNIPEHLRKYLEQRGHYLHAYTDTFNDENQYSASLDQFLEEFPDWDSVKDYMGEDDDYWYEKDHNNFLDLLKHLQTEEKCSFTLSWSY